MEEKCFRAAKKKPATSLAIIWLSNAFKSLAGSTEFPGIIGN